MYRCFLLLLLVATAMTACFREDLRGDSTKSRDGKTYLIIEDDNGGQCGPMKVDDQVWPHAINEAGPITPGTHKIESGESGSVQIEVKPGMTYHFDYWGP
jgi:hypothetical protein